MEFSFNMSLWDFSFLIFSQTPVWIPMLAVTLIAGFAGYQLWREG